MTTLKAEKRDMSVKAKKLRREGFVTGNLFGKNIKGSVPVKIEKKEAERLLRDNDKGSQIMLEVAGESYDVLIKEIDYDSMKNQVTEIDFQALVSGEKVHSVAEIVLLNKEKVIEGVLEQMLEEVSYRAVPEHLVDKVKIDVGDMREGDTLRVKDLEIAKNKDIEILTDLDAVIVNVLESRKEVEETEETEEAAE